MLSKTVKNCQKLSKAIGMHTDGKEFSFETDTGVKREKFRFETDRQTDTRTNARVELRFTAKNRVI